MENLAGNYRCDEVIKRELTEAGVAVFELPARMQHRVPSALLGLLTKDGRIVLKLHRRAHRWEAAGDVPLDVAKELYQRGKVGREEIRAGGHNGCLSPEKQAEWRDDQGHRLSTLREKEKYAAVVRDYPGIFDGLVFVEDSPAVGHGFVTLYHIDSQEGLNLFVKTLREHNIVD